MHFESVLKGAAACTQTLEVKTAAKNILHVLAARLCPRQCMPRPRLEPVLPCLWVTWVDRILSTQFSGKARVITVFLGQVSI